MHVTKNGTTAYTKYYAGKLYEEKVVGGITTKYNYIYINDQLMGMFQDNDNGDDIVPGDELIGLNQANAADIGYYIHTDYLGSVVALSNSAGSIVEEYAYDAWGKRRYPDNWSWDDSRTAFICDRGFTGHEHLDDFALINMNGRMYDPVAGQFISPDPFIQEPGNPLNYNRYSYVLNNPLKYTDPSGYQKYYPNDRSGVNIGFNIWRPKGGGGGSNAGEGFNGSGLNGVYYDWSSNSYRNVSDGSVISDNFVGALGIYYGGYWASVPASVTVMGYTSPKGYGKIKVVSENYHRFIQVNAQGQGGTSALSAAIPMALTAAAVDGPIPVGDLVGLGIITTALVIDAYTENPVFGKVQYTEVGTPFNYISPQPDPQNDFRNNGDRPGLWLGIGIGTIMGLEIYRNWDEFINGTFIKNPTTTNKNQTISIDKHE